ncbi:MAG TPA: 2TM domain-containing protein [Bacteroidia bacterium]|nr:2TM domain-containing protein [Bacteroidia bacterium]
MENEKDKALWKLAKARVAFKRHAFTYLIVNAFFWAIWFAGEEHKTESGMPWPIWPMLGWGIGLAFQYMGAYFPSNSVENEYNKLKEKKD